MFTLRQMQLFLLEQSIDNEIKLLRTKENILATSNIATQIKRIAWLCMKQYGMVDYMVKYLKYTYP